MKNIIKLHCLLICIIYSLSSCVTSKETNLLQDIKKNYPLATAKPEEYKIIPGDQLTIVVYAWDRETADLFSAYTPNFVSQGLNEGTEANVGSKIRSLEGTYNIKPICVYADGTITFPYIGKVYVQGLTIKDIRETISTKLDAFREGTVADVTLANRYFSVLGEAGSDRITMTNTSMTIYQALAIAKTIGPYADRSKVSIIRQTEDGSTVRTFDLRSKDIVDTEFYYIQPNDVIYMPQMKRKFFGTTNSFTGLFSLITSLATVVVFTIKVF